SLEQVEDELPEEVVEPEDDEDQDHEHDEHEDRVVHDLGPVGPGHLAELGPDLTDELRRGRPLLRLAGLWARLRALANGRAVSANLALALHQALHLSVHGYLVLTEQGRRDSNPQPPVWE